MLLVNTQYPFFLLKKSGFLLQVFQLPEVLTELAIFILSEVAEKCPLVFKWRKVRPQHQHQKSPVGVLRAFRNLDILLQLLDSSLSKTTKSIFHSNCASTYILTALYEHFFGSIFGPYFDYILKRIIALFLQSGEW